MLLLVARQQPARQSASDVTITLTGFLWVRAVIIAMQQLSKQILNNEATVSRGVRAEGLS
jgi:hypothetical protein